MKRFRIAANALLMVGLAACSGLSDLTELEVTNENAPDRERVLAQATDIEGVIGGALLVWWEGVEYTEPAWALSTAADEGTMSWGNFGMQQLSSEPRVAWPNDPSFTYNEMTEDPWYATYGALSSVYDGLTSIAANAEAADEIDVDRARAWAKVVQGMAHGFLALMFDSAFVFDENVDLETDILELKPYPDVAAAAVAELEEAISIASGASFTLPNEWFDGNPMTSAQLARFANSYIARLMSQMARTPAERAAADWTKIIGHVNAGITSDVSAQGTGSFERYFKALEWYGYQVSNTTWARADYKTIGWLDTSGNFADWLDTPLSQRNDVLITTPDRRVQGAAGPQANGTDFVYMGPSRFPAARGTYHYSFYGGSRFASYAQGAATIPARWMTTVEMQLIKAEGLLRTGGAAALPEVVSIINNTRVNRGQLPAATIADGDLMDKLIYEKRIEGYLLCGGCAYFDRRGFGPPAPTGPAYHQGPVEGTPAHFPPPGLELNVLQKPMYTYGGVGNEGGTLQPSGAPGLGFTSSGTRAPAALVYRSADARQDQRDMARGAAQLAETRF
jgi:hypothetical protein